MVFNPSDLAKKEGSFLVVGNCDSIAHSCLNKPIFKEFWKNFTFQTSELTITECDEYLFAIGNAEKLSLDGNDYSINIQPDGFCVCAKSEKDLINGFVTLLDRFKPVKINGNLAIEADCCEIRESAIIKNRMVHLCVFPETELWEVQRFVRLCGALKYTHIVLEFWGMFKFACLKELSWPHAFTKEQIKPIIQEANELGLEVIPMFNHWGHASASRGGYGKHVVLDQNPLLQNYFSEDGWCWNIRDPEVRTLLRNVRNELMELCGDGKYFHMGCDEAFSYEFTEENMQLICDFINEVSKEMNELGRRVFIWGDMLLYHYEHYEEKNHYACFAPSPEVERYLLSHLNKNIIIADWQYSSPIAPIETCAVFQNAGFDCMLCPWDRGKQQTDATLTTVKYNSLMGFMHTTWHTLSSEKGIQYVVLMGMGGFEDVEKCNMKNLMFTTATLLRKVMPSNGCYEKAGWRKFQI